MTIDFGYQWISSALDKHYFSGCRTNAKFSWHFPSFSASNASILNFLLYLMKENTIWWNFRLIYLMWYFLRFFWNHAENDIPQELL